MVTNPNTINVDTLNPDAIDAVEDTLAYAQQHYENFPVASFVLPKSLRHPISLIYTFARQADDFADEGEHRPEKRLAMLQGFRSQLDLIQNNQPIKSRFFSDFQDMVVKYNLPLAPFYDLLDAFSQDVTKTRYANFYELLDYCRRSANPIGALLLHLFGKATHENLIYSNKVCTALQLINFYQDVAIDFDDSLSKSRIYLCQDEMEKFGVTEAQIASHHVNSHWEKFMLFNIDRAEAMLKEGKPLEQILPGRIGLEMRMIIGGGEQVLYKLRNVQGDIFRHRPTLQAWDWPLILLKALLR
jgi:squalene synthase HpnC